METLKTEKPFRRRKMWRHCFLCLGEVPSQFKSTEPDDLFQPVNTFDSLFKSKYSLQYLFHHLKVNLDPVQLSKEEKSRLVSLCKGCVALNERFSELYGQLERIRMEVESCLREVHGKLAEADCDKVLDFQMDDRMSLGERRTWGSLRAVTVQKCLQKLQRAHPGVTVEKLKRENLEQGEPVHQTEEVEASPELDIDLINVKTEEPATILPFDPLEMETETVDVADPPPPILVPEVDLLPLPHTSSKCGPDRPPTFHAKPKGKGGLACELCGKKFTLQRNLHAHHLRVHIIAKAIRCGKCGAEFTRASCLRLHEQRVHLKMRKAKCSLCGKQFSQQGELNRHHKIVHLQLKACKCSECGQKFSTPSNLRAHYAKAHLQAKTGKQEEKLDKQLKYKCDLCPKKFEREFNYKRHIKVAHETFRCESCRNTFPSERELTEHFKSCDKFAVGGPGKQSGKIVCEAPPTVLI